MAEDHKNIGPGAKDTQQDREARKNNWHRQHHEDNVKVIGALNSIKNQLVADKKEQERSDKKKESREWLTIWVVVATAAFAFGGNIIFYQTLVEARRAPFIAREDSERSADTAKGEAEDALVRSSIDARNALKDAQNTSANALKAALGANGISQDTANRQLRAYLYVRPKDIANFAVGKSPRWGIDYHMIGQTPAYGVQTTYAVQILAWPDTPDITLYYKPIKSDNKKSIMFPNDTWGVSQGLSTINGEGKPISDYVLTQDEFSALTDPHPTVRIYLTGVTVYTDAFNKLHHTPFCYNYNAQHIDRPEIAEFEVCEKYYKKPD